MGTDKKMSEYVWNPLDIYGMRLYKISVSFPNNAKMNALHIVAAKDPDHAMNLIILAYKECTNLDEDPIIMVSPLLVYQPRIDRGK